MMYAKMDLSHWYSGAKLNSKIKLLKDAISSMVGKHLCVWDSGWLPWKEGQTNQEDPFQIAEMCAYSVSSGLDMRVAILRQSSYDNPPEDLSDQTY